MSWLSAGLDKLGQAIGIGGSSKPKTGPTFASSGYTPKGPIPVGGNQLPSTGVPNSQFDMGGSLDWLKDHAGDFIGWVTSHGGDVAKWIAEHGGDIASYAISHAGDVAGFLKDNAGTILDVGLGAANMYTAAKTGQQSTDYAKKAEDAVTGSYNERAPLRIAGIEGMLHPDAGNAAKLAGVNAIKGPQIAAQPLPVGGADPRLAMVNKTLGRGNPFVQAPLPIGGMPGAPPPAASPPRGNVPQAPVPMPMPLPIGPYPSNPRNPLTGVPVGIPTAPPRSLFPLAGGR